MTFITGIIQIIEQNNMGIQTLYLISFIWLAIAVIVHITMFFITAPFGRHTSEKWGVSINNKIAWTLMEAPSLLIMLYFLFFGKNSFNSFVWILFVLWIIHYFNRTFIYPLRIKSTPKKMPLAIVASGMFFNLVNACLNGYYLSALASPKDYNADWLMSFSFIGGAVLFLTGIIINWKADTILINLRKPGETGYKIPQGFLFKYISSPNLFGEILEWSGFALMAFNLPAFTFMVWTFANLVPRAKNHHDWYLRNFPEYPKERKIVFPFLY
jgi:3-oxo-5-alpha-steroid 4-dehydrogenase 1